MNLRGRRGARRRVTLGAVALLAATPALAACGPAATGPTPHPAGGTSAPSAPAAVSPAPLSAAAQPSGAEDCADVLERNDAQRIIPTTLHCTARSAAFPALTFEYLDPGFGSAAGADRDRDQRVVIRDGAREVQTITEPTTAPWPVAPTFRELTADGRTELLLTTSTGGTGGSGFAVWRPTAGAASFVRAGELFGFSGTRRTDEGFGAMYAHGSAGSGGYAIFRFVDDRIVELFGLEVAMAGTHFAAGYTLRNGDTACAARAPDAAHAAALRDVGIDPATAAAHFCAQPWVGTTYRR